MPQSNFRCGFVALVGRPNVGKSTLLNTLIGEKIAAVSPKAQTTRRRFRGIRTDQDSQIVFVDTPGVHKPTHRMNVRMVDAAMDAAAEVDVVLLVVDVSVKPGPGDRFLLEAIKDLTGPEIGRAHV